MVSSEQAKSCIAELILIPGKLETLLTREEHRLLERQLSNLTANLDEEQVEAAFVRAGLQVERKDIVGSEFKEYAEERTQPGSRTLLRLARLRRSRERLERELPVELLNHIEATLHWELFLFLGKLQPTVYVLTHS